MARLVLGCGAVPPLSFAAVAETAIYETRFHVPDPDGEIARSFANLCRWLIRADYLPKYDWQTVVEKFRKKG